MTRPPNIPKHKISTFNKNKAAPQADTLVQQGLAFHLQGIFNKAQVLYERALKISPHHFDALQLIGALSVQIKNYPQAVEFLTKALKINPNHAACYSNRGNALKEMGHFEQALASYDKAINLKSDYADAYFNRGIVLYELKRSNEALASYDNAIKLKPDYADAYYNRGNAFRGLKRLEEALASYDNVINLKSDYLNAYINRGVALHELKRLEEAIASYDKAINLKPDYAEAYYNRGNALRELKRPDEALENFDKAISLKPDYAEAYYNCGNALRELGKFEVALENYGEAINLDPELDYLLGTLMYTKMQLCDWDKSNDFVNQLTEKIIKQEKVAPPFATLALIDDLKLQKQSAEILINDMHPINNALPSIIKYPKHQKIRIGYFSADFRIHPVSYLTAELFELHDRNQFEIVAFSFGKNTQDSLRQRLEKGFDQFIDVREKSDLQIALLAREMGIDIAVDLGGFTQEARTNIFAMRAAPIQLSYIGYLGTMAAEYFDYLVADSTLIPKDNQHYYSEKIVYLPSFQVNDSRREVSGKIFTREEVGLPENAFVFCCFNNNYKIKPSTFDSWMRILSKVVDSVILLLDANETATKNLKKEAASRGIVSDRIIFCKRTPSPEYLARYRVADLFLDTLPYNAGTTASDALRVGLPVLTQMGESFASRVAASLLNAVGLPELITTTPEAYESLAIELATNPQQLEKVKNKLLTNLPTSPLYNCKMFTQHIESAYQEMYQRYQDGLAPDHIYIEN